jgi:stage II sporulation protein GA (sporulation sigma-E factor processing peptidase)
MKIAIEPFLLDNTLMNCCVYLLAAAWMGVRIRIGPTVLASLIGACYAFASLFLIPTLREPYCKLPCFLLVSLPLFRRSGGFLKPIPFILLAAALTGGAAMLLTLQFGGTVYADGTMVGTVPLRAALLSAVCAACLPRLIRKLLSVRRRRTLHTELTVRLAEHTYRLDALIDSGNLLKDPVSGLPVILIDREVDRPLRPIPFAKASCGGVLYGERPVSAVLPQYGGVTVDCICARAPEPIGAAQAILPESLLPYDWRITDDSVATSYLGTPARAAAHWQTQYLMVRSCKRGTSSSARSGRGSAVHRTCADRQGGKG